MSSAYGESVKFYERMSDLHGQLKTYDEKQYNLQDELERLLKLPHPSEVDFNDSSQQVSRFQPGQTLSRRMDDVTEEESRRQRNQIILEKIKQLESNASVFAARSEKLRIMKREYETLVKKYMSNRKVSNFSYDAQHHPPAAKIIENNNCSLKQFASAGVNTIITGPIKSAEEPEVVASLSTFQYERNLSFTNGSSRQIMSMGNQQGQAEYHLPEFQTERKSQGLDNFQQSIGRFGRESLPIQNETLQNLNETKYNHNQNLNELQPRNLLRGTEGERDEEDSLNEKLRHNPYFDLSTTSESELTSAKNAIKKKMLPININLDDTTQSDTFSLSMHVPTKLSSKTKLGMSAHPLNLSITSEASESSLQIKPQVKHRTSSELTKLINGGGGGGDVERADPCQQSFAERRAPNRRSSLMSLQRSNNDNDNELELLTDSDSSTTSPGDSVMDSVQNRTLNESLTQEPADEENREDRKAAAPPANTNSLGMNTIQKEMDVFLVSDRDKLINESFNKSDEKVKIESSPLTRPGSSSLLRQETNLMRSKGVEIDEFKHPTSTGETKTPLPFQVPSNPSDILNSFTKIEDEFTIGNESLEEIESWERNTISVDDGRKSVESLKKSVEVKKDEVLQKVTIPKPEEPRQQKESTEKKSEDNLTSTGSVNYNQPSKTASTPVSSSSRRVRLKLDYEDSDSEASEVAQGKQKKTNEGNASSVSQAPQKENPVDAFDDDLDDFFDI
ncbi:unnamed protein product [Allacma fusca]|uniref:Centrosomal protein kizuna n=1 Tax=Allacma fusca TaxID=39272 RepID=A0A8J2KYU7_9HEXA|nr:unnamed protein product [Allacma fusca]